MARRLEVEIVADASKYAKGLKDAESKTQKMSRAAGVAGAAIGGALVVGLKKSIDAAKDAQVSQSAMEAQLKASGISYKAHAKQIDSVVQSTSKLAAIDDEDLQDAFTRLTRTTGSVNTALRDTKIAADISRGAHISLEAATKAVTGAEQGRATALRRLGIDLDKHATKQEAIAALQKKFGGAAEAYGKTAAGAQERLGIALENLEESMGTILLPIVTKVAGAMARLAGFLEQHKTLTKVLAIAFGAVATALIAVSVAQKLANLAFLASPWGAVAIAIGALVVGIVLLIKHWDKVKDVMSDLWKWIKGVFIGIWDDVTNALGDVLGWLKDHWPEIAVLISGPFAPIVALATDGFGIRSTLLKAFGVIKTDVEGAVKAVAKFVTDLPSKIGDFSVALITKFKEFFNRADIGGWVVGKIQDFAGFITSIPGKIGDFSVALINRFKGFFNAAQIGPWVIEKIQDFAGFITGLPGKIGDFSQALLGKVTGFITSAQIGPKIGEFITHWASFFGDLPGKVASAVKGKAKDLWDGVKHIFDKLPGFIKDALGISSPSKVFQQIGEAIIQGAIKGIENKAGDLLKAAESAFGKIGGSGLPPTPSAGGGVNVGGLLPRVKMAVAYAQAHGWHGVVTSGWRSYAEQARLYARYVASGFDDRYIAARPGTSSHESGAAVDVSDPGTFGRIMASAPENARLYNRLGRRDPVHFSITGYQYGGVVPGPVGAPQLAVVHGGEAIIPPGRGPSVVVNVYGSVTSERDLARTIRDMLVRAGQRNGGGMLGGQG